MCFKAKSCQAPSEAEICLSHCKQWKYIVGKYGVFTLSKLLFWKYKKKYNTEQARLATRIPIGASQNAGRSARATPK